MATQNLTSSSLIILQTSTRQPYAWLPGNRNLGKLDATARRGPGERVAWTL